MLAPNTLLQDRYLIVKLLGQGGMGAVYQATDRKFGNAVALKETFYSDLDMRKAFSQEAKLLNRLRHAALPVVMDYFSIADKQFLVMQYIPGKDLEQLLNERKAAGQGVFLTAQVLRWADQLLDGLEYLHSQKPQIIHRDIKPQNLKLTPRGEVILLDFGLAKGEVTHLNRNSESIRGYTPNYAPLEQIRGTGTDVRSDVYSMGATLYHLLTGEMPPDSLTRIAAILAGQPDPMRSASEKNPEVPQAIAAVIERAMAPHPDQRYETAAMLRQALRNASGTVETASLHKEPTLRDAPARREAPARTAPLPPPPALGTPVGAQEVPIAWATVAASQPRPGLTRVSAARQELSNKREVLEQRRDAADERRLRRSGEAPKEARRPKSRRTPTLTGASTRAVIYGATAMLLMVMTIGVLAMRAGSTGKTLLAGAVKMVDTSQANVGGAGLPIPIRVEVLRYSLEITQNGTETTRATGLSPLPADSRFKFHFKMKDGGYLYIIARGKNGAPQTFLTAQPLPSSGVKTNWSNSGMDFQFPDGGQWFMIQRDAETAPFTLVYSPTPLQGPNFLAEPSGHELTVAEQQEWTMFRKRFASNKPDLVAMADDNQPAVVVQMPAEVQSGEPLIFDVAVKRK